MLENVTNCWGLSVGWLESVKLLGAAVGGGVVPHCGFLLQEPHLAFIGRIGEKTQGTGSGTAKKSTLALSLEEQKAYFTRQGHGVRALVKCHCSWVRATHPPPP